MKKTQGRSASVQTDKRRRVTAGPRRDRGVQTSPVGRGCVLPVSAGPLAVGRLTLQQARAVLAALVSDESDAKVGPLAARWRRAVRDAECRAFGFALGIEPLDVRRILLEVIRLDGEQDEAPSLGDMARRAAALLGMKPPRVGGDRAPF